MGSNLVEECVLEYNHESIRMAKEKIRAILVELGRKQQEIKMIQQRIEQLKKDLKLVVVEEPLKAEDLA